MLLLLLLLFIFVIYILLVLVQGSKVQVAVFSQQLLQLQPLLDLLPQDLENSGTRSGAGSDVTARQGPRSPSARFVVGERAKRALVAVPDEVTAGGRGERRTRRTQSGTECWGTEGALKIIKIKCFS